MSGPVVTVSLLDCDAEGLGTAKITFNQEQVTRFNELCHQYGKTGKFAAADTVISEFCIDFNPDNVPGVEDRSVISVTFPEDTVTKTGWWSVEFDLTLDGENVRFEDLSDGSREHILNCLREGYLQGELVEEVSLTEQN